MAALHSPQTNDAVLEGYLERESLYLKILRQGWIVLKNKKLYCYKTSAMQKEPIEIINLSEFTSIKRSTFSTDTFILYHHAENGKNKLFRSKDKSTLDKWIQAISIVISNPFAKAKRIVKINKETFIKTSKTKKDHYLKFPTLADYSQQSSSDNAQKANKLTKEILAKTPSGDPGQRDTLLHILNGAAQANGKKCVFFDSSQNIKSDLTKNSYLNAIDGNDDEAAKFVVTLNNLDQFVDEHKYDKVDTLIELKEALSNDEDNPIINGVRNKLATAHGVSVNRIIMMDIYINGNAFVYRVTDLTENEKNKIITQSGQFQSKMQKLFNDYEKCAIHPALLEQSYDISMFDELGNKTFDENENSTYKVGPPGKEREYKQPTGWTRYGLKVLGKYGDDKWLDPFQDPGNWYRAFHGTSREAGSSIFKGAFRPGSNNAYGVGVYCSPDVNVAAGYCRSRDGTIKLKTKKGAKEFYFVFQVAVNPATMNNPQYIPDIDLSCEDCDYWIAPSGADIRPYGILIKEV